MKIHHIGYAVHNIDDAIESFIVIGYELVSKTDDTLRKVVIAFVKNGDIVIELISPSDIDSPIDNILEKNGPSPYHICYEVPNIDDACKMLRKEGWVIIRKPALAPAINLEGSAKVVFLYEKNMGLIELVEIR